MAVVVALIASIPLTPLALWVYARAASVDPQQAIAANERVFRSVPPLPRAEQFADHSYRMYRWNVEGPLVPVETYRTEVYFRLPRALSPRTIVAHYVRVLPQWRAVTSSDGAEFTRDGTTVFVDASSTDGARQPRKSYGVYVSQ
jgi:hypothetical protein